MALPLNPKDLATEFPLSLFAIGFIEHPNLHGTLSCGSVWSSGWKDWTTYTAAWINWRDHSYFSFSVPSSKLETGRWVEIVSQSCCMLLLFSCLVVSDSLLHHGLQHARLSCLSPSPGVCPSSYPLHHWCHPAISSSDALFFFYLQFFPASGTFPMSQLFASGDQNTGVSVSASVLPVNIQGWFPLRFTGLISLSKGLLRVFSNTTVRRHQFIGALSSLWSSSHSHTWPLGRT